METQWAQRVNDWATWTSGRGIASLSSALLQLAAMVYQSPRCNLIRALSHERTESVLQAGPLLLFTPPLFPPSTFPLFSPLSCLHHSTVTEILDATFFFDNGLKTEISMIAERLIRVLNFVDILSAYI